MIKRINCCDLCEKETKKKDSAYWEESPDYVPTMDYDSKIICKKCWEKSMKKKVKIFTNSTQMKGLMLSKKGSLLLADIKKSKEWKDKFILDEKIYF